jgi:hypothetical protein
MATGIIVPGRRLVTQPQYPAPIDKGNPLAQYIEQAYFPAGWGLKDAGVNSRDLSNTGASIEPCVAGPSFKTAGATSSYFNAPSAASTRFTLEAYYVPAVSVSQYICGTQEAPNDTTHDRAFWIDASGFFTFYIYDGSLKKAISATAAVVGKPVHLLGISDGSNIYLYVNGNLESTVAAGTAYTGYASPEFVLGTGRTDAAMAIPGSGWTNYAIRFNRALSPAEARSRYDNKFSLLQAPARRLWVSVGGTTYNQGIAGSLTPAGALAKQTNKPLSGSSTAAGALTKLTSKAFAGSITSTGVLSRSIAKSLAGSLTGTGQLVKQTAKAFAGSVTGSGALSTMILFTASFAGSIAPSGALSKMTQKALAGTSTLTGAITKLTSKGLSASITLSGALNKLTTKAFAGSITVTGALAEAYQVAKSLAGSITPTGALATAYIAFVAGVLKMLSLLGVGQ